MTIERGDAFQIRFIAFIDILGFTALSKEAESGGRVTLQEILHGMELLKGPQSAWKVFQPNICPCSEKMTADVGFQITQASDSVLISTEISPAGCINLIQYCWAIALRLLQKGFMCRGYITKGSLFHDGGRFVGSGYLQALSGEQNVTVFKKAADERGTPFIQVDEAVCDYGLHSDECVRMMFKRMVRLDGKIGGVFPFDSLSHSVVLRDGIDVVRERDSNQNVRKWILDMKTAMERFVDRENPSALAKAQHYLDALQEQLLGCDSIDQLLYDLSFSRLAKR